MKIIIINGPNLNLLGKREKDIYGNHHFEDFLEELRGEFPDIDIAYYQSNVEGELINKLQEVDGKVDGIILNAGGYTHTSVAIADAVKAIDTPVVEVHISNIFAREEYRHISLIAAGAAGSVIGFGLQSYALALTSFTKTSYGRDR
jgi:3-dehydroquinate dehydratase-2